MISLNTKTAIVVKNQNDEKRSANAFTKESAMTADIKKGEYLVQKYKLYEKHLKNKNLSKITKIREQDH